jgi:Spy/CpxP family protein refolding chaperone
MSARLQRLVLVALLVSVLFNLAFAIAAILSQTAADPAKQESNEPQPPARATLLESLELTSGQQERFAQSHDRTAGEIAILRSQVREARENLWRLIATEAPDPSSLEEQVALVSAIQQQVLTLVVQHMMWMRGELATDQKALFDRFVESRMCSCPKCDGGCLGDCSKQCSDTDLAPSNEHSNSECGCGR